jgi:acyl carrier protein
MGPNGYQSLSKRVVDAIDRATYGQVPATTLSASDGSLIDAGVSSLELLRVAEELEIEFNITFAPDEYSALATVDSIAKFLNAKDAVTREHSQPRTM